MAVLPTAGEYSYITMKSCRPGEAARASSRNALQVLHSRGRSGGAAGAPRHRRRQAAAVADRARLPARAPLHLQVLCGVRHRAHVCSNLRRCSYASRSSRFIWVACTRICTRSCTALAPQTGAILCGMGTSSFLACRIQDSYCLALQAGSCCHNWLQHGT